MILSFGKHRGRTCEWVLENDRRYVEWMLRETSIMAEFTEAQNEFRRLLAHKTDNKGSREEPRQEKLPWWDVLECGPTDDMNAIKRAYRKQVSLYHPDKVAQLGIELKQLAEQKTKEINEAYDTAQKLKG